MKKNIVALVAALAVTTGAQAGMSTFVALPSLSAGIADLRPADPANMIKEMASGMNFRVQGQTGNNDFAYYCKNQQDFQMKVQASVLAFTGVALTSAIICMLREWSLDFGKRKAEIEKLKARLKLETKQLERALAAQG